MPGAWGVSCRRRVHGIIEGIVRARLGHGGGGEFLSSLSLSLSLATGRSKWRRQASQTTQATRSGERTRDGATDGVEDVNGTRGEGQKREPVQTDLGPQPSSQHGHQVTKHTLTHVAITLKRTNLTHTHSLKLHRVDILVYYYNTYIGVMYLIVYYSSEDAHLLSPARPRDIGSL